MILNAKIKYHKNIYGELIEKEYSHIKSISVGNYDRLIIVCDDNHLNNYEIKINPTLEINIFVEDE